MAVAISSPDDHFAAGPHCRVTVLGQSGALVVLVAVQLSVPGLYLPAGVQSSSNHQFRPRRSFRCRSTLPCEALGQRARWWCWSLSNCPCWDCISRRCSNSCCRHIRPRRSFRCRSTLPCESIGQRARGHRVLVAVQVSSVHPVAPSDIVGSV